MSAPVKIGATFGHHPERETWSEAHDREMQEEHVARLKCAKCPDLHDRKPRPRFTVAAIVVIGLALCLGAVILWPYALTIVVLAGITAMVLVGFGLVQIARIDRPEPLVNQSENPEDWDMA